MTEDVEKTYKRILETLGDFSPDASVELNIKGKNQQETLYNLTAQNLLNLLIDHAFELPYLRSIAAATGCKIKEAKNQTDETDFSLWEVARPQIDDDQVGYIIKAASFYVNGGALHARDDMGVTLAIFAEGAWAKVEKIHND